MVGRMDDKIWGCEWGMLPNRIHEVDGRQASIAIIYDQHSNHIREETNVEAGAWLRSQLEDEKLAELNPFRVAVFKF